MWGCGVDICERFKGKPLICNHVNQIEEHGFDRITSNQGRSTYGVDSFNSKRSASLVVVPKRDFFSDTRSLLSYIVSPYKNSTFRSFNLKS